MSNFKEIVPILRTISKEKQNMLLNYLFGTLCLFTACAFLYSKMDIVTKSNFFILYPATLLLIGYFLRQSYLKKVSEKIKDSVFDKIAKPLGYSYSPTFIDFNLLTQSGLFENFEFFTKNEEFVSLRDGYNLSVCNAKIFKSNVTDANKNLKSRYNKPVYFDGIMIACKFDDKNIKSRTILSPKNASINYSPLEKTELESTEFNEIFDVYTNDEVESRVILNPTFMEKIVNISKFFHSHDIYAVFYDNTAFIALSTQSKLFDLKVRKDIKEYRHEFSRIANELQLITDLVEFLKLENIYQ